MKEFLCVVFLEPLATVGVYGFCLFFGAFLSGS